jgi:hypothetical protein
MLPIHRIQGWVAIVDGRGRNMPSQRDGSHPTLSPDALENEGSWFGQMINPTECELMWALFAALRKGLKLRIR